MACVNSTRLTSPVMASESRVCRGSLFETGELEENKEIETCLTMVRQAGPM